MCLTKFFIQLSFDHYHLSQQNSTAPKQVSLACPSFAKIHLSPRICPKLLHDSSGLPYVKDRLLSCASKSLDRIAQNPLVEELISSNRLNRGLNPAWDCFPIPLSFESFYHTVLVKLAHTIHLQY